MSEVEKLAGIISKWHGEKKSCPVCLRIAKEIMEAGYLLVEPVQLEVLTDEEIGIITGEGNFRLEYYWQELKAVSQATITHNEAKFGKLYRR